MVDMVDDQDDEEAPSLDQLSRAFAEALGRSPSMSSSSPLEVPETEASPVRSLPDDSGGNTFVPVVSAETHDAVEESSDEESERICPISPKSLLEAILFVGHPHGEPIMPRTVAGLLRGVDPAEVEPLVDELNADYQIHQFPFQIDRLGLGYEMSLTADMDAIRQRLYGRIREARLSRQAIDVLAVVAYRQPISRAEVEKWVGAPAGRLLNQLVRRQLIALQILEKPKQKAFVTTDRFLQFFGLESIADLPRSDEVQ